MGTLLLYRNDDVHLEEPFKIAVPAHIDTLVELCSYISHALPPVKDPAGKGYRFLYSLSGKPVWRVNECLEAGTVVLSTGPGFLARRTMATSDDVAAAKDVTPADAAVRRSGGGGAEAFFNVASQSPPAHQPGSDMYGYGRAYGATAAETPAAAATLGRTSSQPGRMSIQLSASPFPGIADSDAAAHRVSIGGHAAPWMSAADGAAAATSVPAPAAPPADRHVGVESLGRTSDAASVAPRGSGDRPTPTSDPMAAAAAKQLFTPGSHSQEEGARPSFNPQRPSASFVPPPTDLRAAAAPSPGEAATERYGASIGVGERDRSAGGAGERGLRSYERPTYGGRSYTQTSVDGRPTRGEVRIDGVSRPLPPSPTFVSASTLLNEDGFVEDENLLTGLRTYAARKWKSFSELSAVPPTDVLGEDMVQSQVVEHMSSRAGPLRVIVSGPPRSGVSSTAVLALRAAIQNSTREGPLANHLLLVLDSDLLFGAEGLAASAASSSSRQQETVAARAPALLDIPFAFQLVVRAVLDAVAVQRPTLRSKGLVIAQLWDKVVTTNTSSPPDFTTYAQVTAAVGHKVVEQWDRFVRLVFPILQAARRQGQGLGAAGLRDAAVDVIFYALPCELASSLRFSGVTYALDGLHILANSHRSRVERPLGDMGCLLKAIWRDEHCHAIVAWPAAVPLQSIFLTPPSAASGPPLQLRTVGLIPTPSSTSFTANPYQGPPLPQLLECQGRQFSSDVFLGCPGYLAPVAVLARPLVGRTVPTTAFSAYSQHRAREKATEPFHLRVDDAEVGRLLRQLEQLVAVAK